MQISGSHYAPYVSQLSKVVALTEEIERVMQGVAVDTASSAHSPVKSADPSVSHEVQTTLLFLQEAGQDNKLMSAGTLKTNKVDVNTDLDTLFSDNPHASGKRHIDDLPPLLFPSAENIEAISEHASARFRGMLAQYGIPSAPSEIVYSNEGKMLLPSDYPYADDLKQALRDNPGLERELQSLNGMSSHYAELQKRAPFLDEISKASSQAEADHIVRRYSHLFQDNQNYSRITLTFSDAGDLSIKADGKSVPGLGEA